MSEWENISSAKKNGKCILVYAPGDSIDDWWITIAWAAREGETIIGTKDSVSGAGLWLDAGGEPLPFEPTHWMELPRPPSVESP